MVMPVGMDVVMVLVINRELDITLQMMTILNMLVEVTMLTLLQEQEVVQQ